MADVLHRATRELRRSVNTPDYPVEDWIHAPDLSRVTGQPAKYWLIDGDSVTLMSASERAAVDAQETTAAKESEAAQADAGILKALTLLLLDELNALRERAGMAPRTLEQLRTALRGKL